MFPKLINRHFKVIVCNDHTESHIVVSIYHNNARYGVPLFLFLEFVPITVFYLIVLVFQISVTSAPMPCFIISSQFIIATFDLFIMQDRQRPS